MGTLADQSVRDRIQKDLDATLLIEAAAGTGKTTALVSRIVAMVSSGRAELARIVAVTFTEKAAGELKLRLRREIEVVRSDGSRSDEERGRLDRALEQLEEARIGTIHSFCADLLRERPVEARVDPMFEVAPDDVAASIFESAFDRWFEQALESPGEGMRRLLRRRDLAAREGPRAIARSAARELLEWRDFDAAWEPYPFERDPEIDELVTEVRYLGDVGRRGGSDDWLAKSLCEIDRPVAEATRLETVRVRDHDALEAVLLTLTRGRHWNWKGFGDAIGGIERGEVVRRRAALRERLERFREEAGKNLAPLLREELRPMVARYEDLKQRSGRLDFLDLLLTARDLVRDSAAVRVELQRRFSHIFVDEFQDTDPLQAELLMLLASDDPAEIDWTRAKPRPGKLFLVADPKQSIYRFRRADVALYQSVKQRLIEAGATLEHLTVSFRATPALQAFVNAAFEPEMPTEAPTHPKYVPLSPFRADVDSQPSLIVLPVPKPYSNFGRVTEYSIEKSLPDAIAAFVKWLVDESGWMVTERESPEQRVAIRPRHICILFRRLTSFGDVTRDYLRALEARDLPHVLVRAASFHKREEVEMARNLLGAIERPDDELLVFASLRGPLFSFSDEVLLEYRETVGRLLPFARPKDDLPPRLAEIAGALAVIRGLHRERNRRPIAETIARLLATTRAHAGIAIWPTGEQALANLMRIIEMSRRYETRGGASSFRGFVDELELRAERDESGEAPLVEEGTEGVRIMTVHRAKGLEFPIVILADPTCNETREEPSRYVDPARRLAALNLAGCAPRELRDHADEEHRRDEEEAVRLLYVATTRARDLLVVPAVAELPQTIGEDDRRKWLDRLNPAIYPEQGKHREPTTRQPAGSPAEFGDEPVIDRPAKAPPKQRSVAPGVHRPQRGDHNVVWWDPTRLRLDAEAQMGLRQRKLLEADEGGQVSKRGEDDHRQWSDQRATALAGGSVASIQVSGVREVAAAAPHFAEPRAATVRIEETIRNGSRPHGERFGTLVHYTMLRVPFGASASHIEAVARTVARIIGASDDEASAGARAVAAALASPIMLAAAASPEARREYPLLATLDDGTLVEGVADLAYRDGDGWTVVDFKTDANLAPHLGEYRAQVGLYARALAASTGVPVAGVILWI